MHALAGLLSLMARFGAVCCSCGMEARGSAPHMPWNHHAHSVRTIYKQGDSAKAVMMLASRVPSGVLSVVSEVPRAQCHCCCFPWQSLDCAGNLRQSLHHACDECILTRVQASRLIQASALPLVQLGVGGRGRGAATAGGSRLYLPYVAVLFEAGDVPRGVEGRKVRVVDGRRPGRDLGAARVDVAEIEGEALDLVLGCDPCESRSANGMSSVGISRQDVAV